jgi:hypothetical protein
VGGVAAVERVLGVGFELAALRALVVGLTEYPGQLVERAPSPVVECSRECVADRSGAQHPPPHLPSRTRSREDRDGCLKQGNSVR